MSVRVRFAPSPTGALHVGSARTALFNWFFAKHNKGKFILRIEDTDKKRSNAAFLEDILAGLEFLGIRADEGPYHQSDRLSLYREHAEGLVNSGKAIKEEGAIVFPVSKERVVFEDFLHGQISVDTNLFKRIVLIKSDGLPAYNFACVIDDALMEISHVIRGDDHISNTPKQVVLYEALGFRLPVFAHIPLIVGADRARLSKRQGAVSVTEYRKAGYLSEAFVNHLALLGWSPGGDREIISPLEIPALFELDRVRKTAAQFDRQKLDWLNGEYIRRMPLQELSGLLARHLLSKKAIREDYDRSWLERIAAVVRDRLKVLDDILNEHGFFFKETVEYQEDDVKKFLRQEGVSGHLLSLRDRLNELDRFDTARIERIVCGFVDETKLKSRQLIHPLRVAVTGKSTSPPLFEVMSIVGREKVLRRLEYAATMLAKTG